MDILTDVTYDVNLLLYHLTLSGISVNDFSKPKADVIRELKRIVDKKIGEGGVGRIFDLKGYPRYIVKVTTPTLGLNKCLDRYVDTLERGEVFESIYPSDPSIDASIKTFPNTISETLVGAVLSGLSKHCDSFGHIYRAVYTPEDLSTYIVMEKLRPGLGDILNNEDDFICFLLQVCYALWIAQEKHKFTHYDLHIDNILFELSDSEDFIGYPMKNGKTVYVRNRGFNIKIIDYGMARAEYHYDHDKKIIITPMVDTCPHMHLGVFDPYYDILSVMGCFLAYKNAPGTIGDKFLRFKDSFIDYILNVIYGNDDIGAILKTYYNRNSSKEYIWRPKDQSGHKYPYIPNCGDIMIDLASYIVGNNQGYYDPPVWGLIKSYDRLSEYNIDNYSPLMKSISLASMDDQRDVGPGITMSSYKVVVKSRISEYNRTPVEKQIENCERFPERGNLSVQYITEVLINPRKAYKAGYRFKFACCKVDPIDYLIETKSEGVAINGGFFNLESHTPIGLFKNEDIVNDIDSIPLTYRSYYGIVYLDENDQLGITKVSSHMIDRFRSDNKSYMSSGPLLVMNGRIVFDETTVETMKNISIDGVIRHDVSIFQCDISRSDVNQNAEVFLRPNRSINETCSNESAGNNSRVRNCSKIKPGELSHASNPNPRSMLAITENDLVIFVVVEGRENRGFGMDLVQLAQFARSRLNAKYAINLDGGRSSRMSIRMPNDQAVYTMTEDMKTKYPAGDILSLVRPITK